MAPRSDVARHIVSRIDLARRLDPTATVRGLTRELGISSSSYYKMKQGTRSGRGSIERRVMTPPKQGTLTVTFTDGTRTASRNIHVPNQRSKADALVLRHDPKTRRALVRRLEQEERGEARRRLGSPAWKRKQRAALRVTRVTQPEHVSTESFLVRGRYTR